MKTILTILFASLTLLSCSKEEHPRVEYKVSSSGSALIAYTMVTPSVRQETVSGSWDVSFRHSKGGNVFLSAINIVEISMIAFTLLRTTHHPHEQPVGQP